MSVSSHVHRELYISSGLKNGFYTLRVRSRSGHYCADNYLRNLSTDPDKAERLAREYYDRVYGKNCQDVVLLGYADFDLTKWGTALQPWERQQIMEVDAGYWPFGKYKGTKISDAPDGYLMYFAKQPTAESVVMTSLVERCRSIADERGLSAKYEERQREIAAQKLVDAEMSQHVGKVGERRGWQLTVRGKTRYEGHYGWTHIYIMADDAGNVVVGKFSKALPEVESGDRVVLKATVKEHGERDGVKQTIINRPVFAA